MPRAYETGPQWDSHLSEQAVENVEFLLAAGESLDRALKRAGVSESMFKQRRHRGASSSS